MEQLRIPGPTPIPDDVRQAMARQMINHRGPEFAETINRITENLKTFFQTENDIFLMTGSGTGGLEAAAVNMMSPGRIPARSAGPPFSTDSMTGNSVVEKTAPTPAPRQPHSPQLSSTPNSTGGRAPPLEIP